MSFSITKIECQRNVLLSVLCIWLLWWLFLLETENHHSNTETEESFIINPVLQRHNSIYTSTYYVSWLRRRTYMFLEYPETSFACRKQATLQLVAKAPWLNNLLTRGNDEKSRTKWMKVAAMGIFNHSYAYGVSCVFCVVCVHILKHNSNIEPCCAALNDEHGAWMCGFQLMVTSVLSAIVPSCC